MSDVFHISYVITHPHTDICIYIYIYIQYCFFIFIQEMDVIMARPHVHVGQAAPALTVRMTNGFARSMWGLVGTAHLRHDGEMPPSHGLNEYEACNQL